MEAARYRVFGLVQGVGFRFFTLRLGRELGLCGWVRNHPDGSVEVLAAGPPAQLRQLEARLRQGPPTARVERVTVRPHPLEELSGETEFFILS